MSENQKQDEKDAKTVVINYTPPTTKQQLTSAAIQVGAALALPVLLVGGGYVASKVGSAREKRAARKAANSVPNLSIVTDESTAK